jgi:hypothetical protein
MKLENLKVGQTIKNYKELCSLLEVPIKSGKSKALQITDFERYFNYKKQGNSFIIVEIYEVPKDKIDMRSQGNNSTYCDDVTCST